jgi:hypothetical protein
VVTLESTGVLLLCIVAMVGWMALIYFWKDG